jgi:hypothetical protein
MQFQILLIEDIVLKSRDANGYEHRKSSVTNGKNTKKINLCKST